MAFPLPLSAVLTIIAAVLFVLVAQPMLLKASVSACGEKSMGFMTAIAALIVAGVTSMIGGALYGLTLGALISQFSVVLSILGSLGVSWLISGVVYSAFLRVSMMRGIGVSIVYHIFAVLFSGAVALAVRTLLALFS